jgi:endo-alpha-1,4-polygalactosaminidase (GH114 family)
LQLSAKNAKKKSVTFKTVQESILNQLQENGADLEVYIGLVDDFMFYYKQEKEMQKDVKERGRFYNAISSQGKEYEKENPSIKNAILCNKQKLAILKEIGISPEKVQEIDDEETDGDL